MLVYGFHVPSWKCNVDEKKICNILNYQVVPDIQSIENKGN